MSRQVTDGMAAQDTQAQRKVERGRRSRWWRRQGSRRRGFWYIDADGRRITDEAHLQRIRLLAIPPAWTHVRICPSPRGRLQAVGIDSAGRMQYRYHEEFAAQRSRRKFARIIQFGRRLPALRRITNEHLCMEGFGRERVLAVVLRLINSLYFRLGTDRSARTYRTYGVTTLRNRHCRVLPGGCLEFRFNAKHAIPQRKVLVDPELAGFLQQLKQIGGARLFNYVDADGAIRPVRPEDVNAYIRQAMGPEFSAKDFRTWAGTVHAAVALAEMGPPQNEREARKRIARAVKSVAQQLGNTPAVCRACYIHPKVLEMYVRGETISAFRPRAERLIRGAQADYDIEELALLAMLEAD